MGVPGEVNATPADGQFGVEVADPPDNMEGVLSDERVEHVPRERGGLDGLGVQEQVVDENVRVGSTDEARRSAKRRIQQAERFGSEEIGRDDVMELPEVFDIVGLYCIDLADIVSTFRTHRDVEAGQFEAGFEEPVGLLPGATYASLTAFARSITSCASSTSGPSRKRRRPLQSTACLVQYRG